MPEYVYQPYPACRYHPTLPAIVVRSEAEDAALGPGWVDHPSKFLKAKKAEVPPEAPSAEEPAPAESDESDALKTPRPRKK